MQGAIRITEADPSTVYFRCGREPGDELKIVSTSLPRQRGRGTVIREEWPLHGALDRLLSDAGMAQCREKRDITDEIIRCRQVTALLGADNVRVVAEAGFGNFPDIRVAARVTSSACSDNVGLEPRHQGLD